MIQADTSLAGQAVDPNLAPDGPCVALMDRALSEQDWINFFRFLYEQAKKGGRNGLAAAALLLKYKFGLHPELLDQKPGESRLVIRSLTAREPGGDG